MEEENIFDEFEEEDFPHESFRKRKGEGYSGRSIDGSMIEEGYFIRPIPLTYGVVTPCSSWDHSIKIDSKTLTSKEVYQKLEELSKRTNKRYSMQVIHSESGEKGEFDGLAVIGRDIEGEDIEEEQRSHKLVSGNDLTKILEQSDGIVKDLETLGFRNINSNDLYLYTKSIW